MAAVVLKTVAFGYVVPVFPECPHAGKCTGTFVECQHPEKNKDIVFCSTLHMGNPYIPEWITKSSCPMDEHDEPES